MEYTPPNQPPRPNPEAPRPNANERGGFFDRWRTKKEKSQPEADPSPESPKSNERPQKEKSRREKFAENVGKFIFGEGVKKDGAEPADTSGAREQHRSPEDEPLIDRAERVRRFARNVMNHVFGTARAEREHGREWDGQEPLDTEPLFEAAEDLGDAAEDLDDAARSYRASGGGGDYGGTPRGARAEAGGESATSFTARAAERMTQRLEDLEKRVQTEAEKSEAHASALRAGLGIMAVAGVLLIGHEYLAHKKIRKDQKELRTVQAEQNAEIILQKQQLEEMTRRERAAHYERLSQLTHKQADVTREVAGDLQEETRVLQIIRGPQTVESQTVEARPRTERVAARPEDLTDPAVTVENADNVERGAMSPFNQSGPQQQVVGMNAAGLGIGADGKPVSQVPLSPAAQRALAARQARAKRLAANGWFYGAVLAGGLGIVGLLIVLFG